MANNSLKSLCGENILFTASRHVQLFDLSIVKSSLTFEQLAYKRQTNNCMLGKCVEEVMTFEL